jgi:hypothetical protein
MYETLALATYSQTNEATPIISGRMILPFWNCYVLMSMLINPLVKDCMNELDYLECCRDSVIAEYWVIDMNHVNLTRSAFSIV